MRYRSQIERLAHQAPAAKNTSATQNLPESITAARRQHHVARPVSDALLKSIEVALPTQHVLVTSTAAQRSEHRQDLDVVHSKRLVRRSRAQACLEAKCHVIIRVRDHQLDPILELHPPAVV